MLTEEQEREIREAHRTVGEGGVDITGGIPSHIYIRLRRDDCSESIWDYIYGLIGEVSLLLSSHAELRGENQRLRGALEEISVPKGPFSRDPLTHAKNVIEHLKNAALAALQGSEG